MENASKALLIAGEVLIGLIVLSIFAFAFEKAYEFAESYQDRSAQQKIVAFNTQYTKYNTGSRKHIYSEDVVTLTEQVLNWNQTTVIDSEKIRLNILDERGGLIYSTFRLQTDNYPAPFHRCLPNFHRHSISGYIHGGRHTYKPRNYGS